MRRIVMWFMSTVTVVVLLFGYHTSTTGAQPQQTVVTAPLAGSSGSSGSSPSRSTAGSGSGTSNNGKKAAPRVVTGPVVQTQWGPVEVQIKVANGRISQVAVPTYPSGNGTDAQINSYALPRLVQETLGAQSAHIQMISGATVTSTGYVQ